MFPQPLSSLSLLLGGLLAATSVNAAPGALNTREDRKPIYAIAHKILTVKELDVAIIDHPSAIEVDFTAWRKGDKGDGDDPADTNRWWMDHNGDGIHYGDPSDDFLKAVNDRADDAPTVSFIMFDIKTPDYCKVDEEGCGMAALVKMAKDYVISKGIRVIYGFTNPDDASGDGFKYVVQNLDDSSAVRITGKTDEVLKAYEDYGKDIPTNKRFLDYGNAYPNDSHHTGPKFGECKSEEDSDEVCPLLIDGVKARDDGKIGKVFAWTFGSSKGDGEKVYDLFDHGIDGIVYGYGMTEYESSDQISKALAHIHDYIYDHWDDVTFATRDDPLF